MMDRIGDGFFSVRNLYIFSIGFCHTNLDIIDDRLWFFITWIIRGNDGKVCKLSGNLSHLIAAKLRSVASASKQTYQSVGMIFFQSGQKTLQSHGIMRVIDHQSKIIGYFYHFDTAFYLSYF